MTRPAEIFVALPDELVDVWRPVQAERLRANVYRIVEQPYDRAIEKWQFEPGDIVECEYRKKGDDLRILVASRRAMPS